MILTDGQENASHEFRKSQIKEMIDKCKEKNWYVAYLSADADAFEDAKSLGIGRSNTSFFSRNSDGANIAMMTCSYAASDYRTSGAKGMSSMASYSARARSDYTDRKKKYH